MSIVVTQIRLPYGSDKYDAIRYALRKLGLSDHDLLFSDVYKESLDLRHGGLSRVYSIELSLHDKKKEVEISEKNTAVLMMPEVSMPEATGNKTLSGNPIVIGFGPAGMFASLVLAECGFAPIVLERGKQIEDRDADVSLFFKEGKLDPSSNIQFGEGGAGTYSDGKLTTRINDPLCLLVMRLLKDHGAPEEIMHMAKPHIGTDQLKKTVVSIRKRVEDLGGRVFFNSCVTDIRTENGKVRSVVSSRGIFESETVILAIGHSARDTFEHLFKKGVTLIPKAFSVGLRIEHLQKRVNESVYGRFADKYDLPAAEYAVSAKKLGRGCYSFCMCPGGSVIAASSEEGMLVTNGMSYHARNGSNANSALCVSVNPDDFERSPLGGIAFQRSIEKAAFEKGGGGYAAPIQTVGDFLSGSLGTKPDTVKPSYPLPCTLTDFSEWMPEFVTDTLKASFSDFSKSFSFFSDKSAVFTGVETRTSSPVRIIREEDMQASGIKGLFPCGEGAGYAGGIMSAAVDGIKAAKQILSVYKGVK